MNPMPQPASTPSSALVAAFLTSRAETCNFGTRATYAAYLNPFATWLDGRAISALTIGAYLTTLRERKLARATVTNAQRILKTMSRWLYEQGDLESDPFAGPGRVKPVAQKRKRRKVYTDDQVVQLLVTAQARIAEREEAQRWRPSANPYLLRDAQQSWALVLLLCDSALRAAEVCALTCKQIREDEMIVQSKGDNEDVAFISPITRQALRNLAGDRPDAEPLFRDIDQKKCSTRALRGCLGRLAERAGVPLVPRPLHAFRHLAARQWLKSGLGDLAIQQLMRHSSLATTRIYTQLDAAELAELHGKHSPIARYVSAAQAVAAAQQSSGPNNL
jgi:integrase